MPTSTFVIFDSVTGLYCHHYSINLNFCSWSDVDSAQTFAGQTQVDGAITQWGETPGERFIGKNPRPH